MTEEEKSVGLALAEELATISLTDEAKLAPAAFAVFADWLASEVAADVQDLDAKVDRLAPLRDYLGDVKVLVGREEVVASGHLADAVIISHSDFPGPTSLLCRVDTDITTPLAAFRDGMGDSETEARLNVSNQTAAVFLTGGAVDTDIDQKGGVVLTLISRTYAMMRGDLSNLTTNDIANIEKDDDLIARYLLTGEGLESSDVSFTPFLVQMLVTPGLQEVIGLIGPLKKYVDGSEHAQPPGEGVVAKPDYLKASPVDLLRVCVANATGNVNHIDLAESFITQQYEARILSDMHELVGTLEVGFGESEAPFRVTLDGGARATSLRLGDLDEVWSVAFPGGSEGESGYSVPIGKVTEVWASLSGTKVMGKQIGFHSPIPNVMCVEIAFFSGISVRGFVNGYIGSQEQFEAIAQYIMSAADSTISIHATLEIVEVSVKMSSIEGVLHMLGIDTDPTSTENDADEEQQQ